MPRPSPIRPLALCTLALLAAPVLAQGEPWYDHDPLPQGMTAEEEMRRAEIGAGFTRTAPPPASARAVAEFEQAEAVLIRYPLGIPLDLVRALSEHTRVITIVSGQGQENQARAAYTEAGVDLLRADFLHAPSNSIWTRDYGPFYVADAESREIGLVDFVYNRPRASDDAIPTALGAYLGAPVYAMDVVHTGGNYMADGHGTAASTDLLWEENDADPFDLLGEIQSYLGVDTYHVTLDPQDSYLKHIDTWGKFLDVDQVLLSEVPPSHPRYDEHESVAAYFASQTSAYGTPYTVHRVYTPNGQPYTNSLIVNDRVFVPIAGSAWDDEALEVYRQAMPGYTVEGFAGSWLSTDALHCRVKQVADRQMLSIRHQPITAELPHAATLDLEAEIVPYSGAELVPGALLLIASVDDAPADTLTLQSTGDDRYTASLPIPDGGASVAYYFAAADASGRTAHFPLVGPAAPHTVTVNPLTVSAEPVTTADRFQLAAPYPNPAVAGATMGFALPEAGPITLDVLDLLGRRVALLHDGLSERGEHHAWWDARSAAPGVYLIRLQTPEGVQMQRLTVQ